MTTTKDAGKKGAEIRNKKLTAEERSEASRKAAATRKVTDPNAFSKMGKAGAEARSYESRVEAGKKAARTRKQDDPQAFSKMGQKGGASSQGKKSDINVETEVPKAEEVV